MDRPRNVALFEVLMYFGLLLDAGAMTALNRLSFDGWIITEVFTFYLMLAVFVVFLVWSAARRARSWARWMLLVLLFTSVSDYFYIFSDLSNINYAFATLRILSDVLQIAALGFVFSPNARPWFAPAAAVPLSAAPESAEASNNQ